MISTRHFSILVFLLCVLTFAARPSLAAPDEENATGASVENALEQAAAATGAGTGSSSQSSSQAGTPPGAIPGFFSFGNQATPLVPPEEPAKKKQVYYGETREDYHPEPGIPPSLDQLSMLPKEPGTRDAEGEGLPFDIRRDAIREAAISYGARGGLASFPYKIRQELQARARYLDKIYDFRQFMIPGPSGMMIEPPIITEGMNALLIENGGQTAAVSDRIYNIINNANIVSSPRNWRSYLEREWGDVEPPPDILRPETEEERRQWQELVAEGWEEGVKQADEIFQDDLNVLTADFQGMIRYRSLLAQGMVSPPYALQVDRGVTGNGEGDEMRVGDRAVQITGKPRLITGTDQWQPANQ